MDERPEILPVEVEQEILYQRLCDRLTQVLPRAIEPGLVVSEDAIDTVVATVATGMLRYLRVMSGRQLAVLLAREANRGERYVIHEPPPYTAEEVADAR